MRAEGIGERQLSMTVTLSAMSRLLSSPDTMSRAHEQILDAVVALDGDRLRDVVLRYADQHGNDALVADVLVPTLRRIGVMWERGRLGVMHEHLASVIVRSSIGQLTCQTPTAAAKVVLSCPPGELHDLPLHLFSLMLVQRHLDPLVLGADTPIPATAQTARAVNANVCVITTLRPRAILAYRGALERDASAFEQARRPAPGLAASR